MKGYRCVLGLIIGVLVSGLQSGRAQDVLGHSGTPPRTSLPQSPTSITTDNPLRGADSVRGTITVIVSTRQGFVLAADSRATHSNGTHTDDAQKLFAIGNRAACVIAGLVQTGLGEQGFYVRDAMATNLNMLSENSNQTHTVNDAWSVTRYFLQTFSGMVGVLEHRPDGIIPAGNVGEVSAVSIDDSGKAQWITFYVPVDIVADRPNDYVVATSMPVVLYRPMDLGLRFDVGVLGQPEIAWKMLRANTVGTDQFSQTPIMKKYYFMKRQARLDSFSLLDATDLARVLVQATETQAPVEAGVGGPIDIATLTTEGVKWVQKKTVATEPSPRFRIRFSDMTLPSGTSFDGIECLSCTIPDGAVYWYRGQGDANFIDLKFQGRCSLVFGPDAVRTRPETVQKLKDAFRAKCSMSGGG